MREQHHLEVVAMVERQNQEQQREGARLLEQLRFHTEEVEQLRRARWSACVLLRGISLSLRRYDLMLSTISGPIEPSPQPSTKHEISFMLPPASQPIRGRN